MRKSFTNFFISTIILLLFSIVSSASGLPDEINSALKLPQKEAEVKLYNLIKQYIVSCSIDNLQDNKKIFIAVLIKCNLKTKMATIYEVQTVVNKRLLKLNEAKSFAQKGIKVPGISEYQLIRFLTLLAYIETDLENYLSAIENYMFIEKLLKLTNKPYKMMVNYIGQGDLYNKAGLYKEALNSFTYALNIAQQNKVKVHHLIYENMAISYFNLKNQDSLQYYSDKILEDKQGVLEDSTAFYRLNYMKFSLAKDPRAIDEIKKLLNDGSDGDRLLTVFNMAKAYVDFNQLDSAKLFINKIVTTGDFTHLVFLGSQLNKLRSDIYLKEGQYELSLFYYKKSVEQLTNYSEKQFKSDNILARLKYYDVKNKYDIVAKDLDVRKNYLLLFTVIAIMIILTLFFLYRAMWIKKKFNTLKYNKLNNEISMINSHEVRKHLSNILGIIEVIKISEDKSEAFQELEKPLLDSSQGLDSSIKNIAKKLNSQSSLP